MATTYRTLYDTALSTIKSVCLNVSNFAGLPAAYKSGYTYSQTKAGTTGNASYKHTLTLKWTVSNPISEIATSTVDSDFKSLMESHGVYAILDKEVTPRGLINFYKALAIFCSARVCIASSQLSTGRYLVYDRTATFSSMSNIPEGYNAVATDVTMITNNIISVIGNNAKSRFVRYTTTLTTA